MFVQTVFRTYRYYLLGRVPGADPCGHIQLPQLGEPEPGRLEVCHRPRCAAGSAGECQNAGVFFYPLWHRFVH
jgi:hypothetical protein